MSTISEPVIVRDEGILGGRPIFRGTRVQVELLFENLAQGYSIDDIVENFPTLERYDLERALLQACDLVKAAAPSVGPASAPEAHARLLR